MAGVSKLMGKETLERAEKALKECQRKEDVSWKLKAIIATEKFGVTHVATIFNVSRLAVTRWIKSFITHGVDGLKTKPGQGRKCILRAQEQAQVKVWLSEDPNKTIQAIQEKIETTFKKRLGKSAVHNLMKRLDFSYITPRPMHHKQENNQKEAFKKKSPSKSNSHP